ncbi:hypothetical protein B0H16DRAFT_1550366 [Mycena metata]|uniref:Uncharacterized protein n=1 Tax=Mycena metata TaxID=1033252 RepID=A0AAD7IUZ4_9AGAR|nr:hypothetical protein B0H16DRAFT_1550366 [Mycena metata]
MAQPPTVLVAPESEVAISQTGLQAQLDLNLHGLVALFGNSSHLEASHRKDARTRESLEAYFEFDPKTNKSLAKKFIDVAQAFVSITNQKTKAKKNDENIRHFRQVPHLLLPERRAARRQRSTPPAGHLGSLETAGRHSAFHCCQRCGRPSHPGTYEAEGGHPGGTNDSVL